MHAQCSDNYCVCVCVCMCVCVCVMRGRWTFSLAAASLAKRRVVVAVFVGYLLSPLLHRPLRPLLLLRIDRFYVVMCQVKCLRNLGERDIQCYY